MLPYLRKRFTQRTACSVFCPLAAGTLQKLPRQCFVPPPPMQAVVHDHSNYWHPVLAAGLGATLFTFTNKAYCMESTDSPEQHLQAGVCVKVKNLQHNAELNGQYGELLGFEAQTGRWD
eukprot:6955987-Karenia_brevis.AAC.1